tara:strand:- start:100 stop:303 length:204 start_codon:yes stop_codon:yes gene_type:complete
MDDGMVVWAFSGAEVIHNPMCQKQLIVNGNLVIASRFVNPGYKFTLFNPSQAARVFVGKFQEFFDAP